MSAQLIGHLQALRVRQTETCWRFSWGQNRKKKTETKAKGYLLTLLYSQGQPGSNGLTVSWYSQGVCLISKVAVRAGIVKAMGYMERPQRETQGEKNNSTNKKTRRHISYFSENYERKIKQLFNSRSYQLSFILMVIKFHSIFFLGLIYVLPCFVLRCQDIVTHKPS